MQLYLVRHAHAGHRSQDGRDIYRPLSEQGQDRATQLVEVFAGRPVDRIMSSPATRCMQTLGPLAADRGHPVVECQDLWEGSSIADAISAMEIEDVEHVVACSHGDIIPGLIDTLGGRGASIVGRGCELGSIWLLDFQGGTWQGARYLGTKDNAPA